MFAEVGRYKGKHGRSSSCGLQATASYPLPAEQSQAGKKASACSEGLGILWRLGFLDCSRRPSPRTLAGVWQFGMAFDLLRPCSPVSSIFLQALAEPAVLHRSLVYSTGSCHIGSRDRQPVFKKAADAYSIWQLDKHKYVRILSFRHASYRVPFACAIFSTSQMLEGEHLVCCHGRRSRPLANPRARR